MTVKVSEDEAKALSRHGSPSKGLRHLIDKYAGTGLVVAVERPSGRCRIHKNWTEPVITMANGVRTSTKTCTDCGFVSIQSGV